jgi:hypothetical protein
VQPISIALKMRMRDKTTAVLVLAQVQQLEPQLDDREPSRDDAHQHGEGDPAHFDDGTPTVAHED